VFSDVLNTFTDGTAVAKLYGSVEVEGNMRSILTKLWKGVVWSIATYGCYRKEAWRRFGAFAFCDALASS